MVLMPGSKTEKKHLGCEVSFAQWIFFGSCWLTRSLVSTQIDNVFGSSVHLNKKDSINVD